MCDFFFNKKTCVDFIYLVYENTVTEIFFLFSIIDFSFLKISYIIVYKNIILY